MNKEKVNKTKETKEVKKVVATEVSKDEATTKKSTKTTKGKFVNKKFGAKRGSRKSFSKKPRSEYEQKIVSIRRVTRVVAGGRRFSFSVAMIIGDRKGSVGFGLGKATDTALAIEKAIKDAKKNMIRPNLTTTMSLPYDVEAKYNASRVLLVPAPGKGVKAGGAMRTILNLLGAKDISAKILSRSKNNINNSRATIDALRKIGIKSPIKVKVETDKQENKKEKEKKKEVVKK